MPHYQSGEVILIQFLLQGETHPKRRPGLVLLDKGDEGVLISKVTSQPTRTAFDVEIVEWEKAGLPLPSVVRLYHINTLEKNLVGRRLGILSHSDWMQVRQRLQQLWSCV